MIQTKTNLCLATLFSAGLLSLASGSVQAAWPDAVDFSGEVVFEGGWYSGYGDNNSTLDMTIYSFSLGLEAALNEKVSATIGFLYEEDATDFGFDEGYITLNVNDGLSVQLGQMYIPFGSFNSNMVNDPFALSLGEATETIAMANFNMGVATLSPYVFNGSIMETGDEESIDSFGFRVTGGNDDMSVTFDYLSNLHDTDGFTDALGVTTDVAEFVGGMSIAATAAIGSLDFGFEYLAALDETSPNKEPSTLHFEVGMDSGNNCGCYFALAFQQSDDAEGMLPESRISLGYSRSLMEVLSLNTELYFDSDYDTVTDDTATGFVVDIAAQF